MGNNSLGVPSEVYKNQLRFHNVYLRNNRAELNLVQTFQGQLRDIFGLLRWRAEYRHALCFETMSLSFQIHLCFEHDVLFFSLAQFTTLQILLE